MQRQDSNSDLNSFFNDGDMASSTLLGPSSLGNQLSWGGMDQLFDFNGGSEYPFPGSQPAFSSAFTATQAAPTSFMSGLTPHNMVSMNNGRLPPASEFVGQATAAPSVLFNNTNTPSGYNTRQAAGMSTKRPIESIENTEAAEEPPQKKPRKTRKKRSKELSQAEQEDKRQKFLDRNKVAAHKCRQRKKEWTDSLQTRANNLNHENQALSMQKASIMAELEMLKLVARQCPVTCPSHSHLAAVLNEFDSRPPNYYDILGDRMVAEAKEARRNAPSTPDQQSRDQSQVMSRQNSGQSSQSFQSSTQLSSQGRTERVDSGISNMGTPEKSLDRKDSIGDEAVDVGSGFPYMMGNQRLGYQPNQWNHGLPNKSMMGPLADLPGSDPSAFIFGVM